MRPGSRVVEHCVIHDVIKTVRTSCANPIKGLPEMIELDRPFLLENRESHLLILKARDHALKMGDARLFLINIRCEKFHGGCLHGRDVGHSWNERKCGVTLHKRPASDAPWVRHAVSCEGIRSGFLTLEYPAAGTRNMAAEFLFIFCRGVPRTRAFSLYFG